MADGQTEQVPEASVESRLEAFFSPGEAKVEEKPEEVAQEEATTEEVAEEVEQEAAPEGYAEIEDDDGQTYRVPEKLKESFLRWKDYSQKTAQVSEIRKAAEDRMMFAEAREQVFGQITQDIAEFKSLQAQRQQFENVDWGALYNADLGQAVKLRDQRDMLDRKIAEMAQGIQGKASHAQKSLADHQQYQWQLAVTGAKQALGNYTEADDAAAAKWVQTRNVSEKELKGRFAAPWVLEAVHKAAKWDAIQGGKSAAVAKAQAAPVIKPGASSNMPAQVKQDFAFRKAMKATSNSNERAKLIERNLAGRFK